MRDEYPVKGVTMVRRQSTSLPDPNAARAFRERRSGAAIAQRIVLIERITTRHRLPAAAGSSSLENSVFNKSPVHRLNIVISACHNSEAMPINQSFLGELEHEFNTTRKVIARIPDDKLGWKPHERSMTAGELASHIAEMYSWCDATIKMDEIDLAPLDGPKWEGFKGKTTAEILTKLDESILSAKAAIAGATDDAIWMKTWSLKMGGQAMMTMPRVACVRSMIMNHIVHHRGQLSLYLRLLDIPVPSIYGPSADEQS